MIFHLTPEHFKKPLGVTDQLDSTTYSNIMRYSIYYTLIQSYCVLDDIKRHIKSKHRFSNYLYYTDSQCFSRNNEYFPLTLLPHTIINMTYRTTNYQVLGIVLIYVI